LTHNSDIVTGGWWQSGVGIVVSAWSWLVGDANGLTIFLTAATLILTLIKIADAVRRFKAADGGSVAERWRRITHPNDLDSRPHHHSDRS
jgi:hypothetical protein